MFDIIKTIEDDQEVENYSDESDAEITTDDKIKKARLSSELKNDICQENDNKNIDNENILSDDELVYDNIKVKQKKGKSNITTKDDFFDNDVSSNEKSTFYEMNLSRPLMKAIAEMKFVHPTPIQISTIPVALLGKDICGCAATGTGKTAAYMLPTLERLLYRPIETAVTRVLVLVPTRELGVQVYQVSKQLAQFTNIEIALSVGGLDLKVQENMLRKNPDIVIATPGRLIDHLKSTPSFSLDSIEILILDEADRMLDEFFAEQMKEIIKQCSRTRQTLLFSATMTDEVEDLAAVSLTKPVRVFVDSNKEVAFNLRQEFIRIRHEREADRESILCALVCRTFKNRCIIFVQTKKQAHRIHILLGLLGIRIAELHGNLTQPQRLDALQKFKDEQVDVLVATDVAARGLDIPGIRTVINFMMPPTLEHYIHRVGRTARAGRGGVSVSLAGEQERKIVKEIIKGATNPVKSRIIPLDILEKYKSKLEQLETKIEHILQEEYEERLLSKTENQANRAEKLLKGGTEEKRPWFQSTKERKLEKAKLALPKETKTDTKPKNKNKKQKKNKDTPEDRIQVELKRLALLQSRLAKRKSKPKRLNTCVDSSPSKAKKVKRKKSNFTDEICNTSNKSTKKYRYESNLKKKMANKNKGKAFGKPMSKQKRK
ncbi:atp-dependent rna helicase rhle-related [Holotrichia oblita]|uniref:Atp-dependent rna helicase rhle-related n=1 Tax=Holotrichia oblita TaxID=644536 RepID=A0ACB9TNB1_HOLOL|nr:atp-dependent rna helicase rhle-related [Holotrichia oblita]